ncbi:BrnT family toxin [Leptospira dzoumogneensis]|uniref:BrnT family toxin n=1 Tax=Leptospira dzoumogneensis TaxID=2484904 RepID=A0A4Z1AL19_9LEPT|nr:BrnT family toxin [Leptospira dzoumogneensis]TGN00030.1 BrnT family toxin [Leptospira dzoumogneensis]
MSEIDFEWDSVKNLSNKRKHGISFEEAKTVFFDENARVINDPEHSEEEERFIILGFSYKLNLLMVSHCYRSSKDIIRIISARKATKSESKQYETFL